MSRQTSEEKLTPLLGSPANGDVEWAKVINRGVGKGRRLVCEPLWEVSYDRLNGCRTEFSAQDAVRFSWNAVKNVVYGLHNIPVPLTVSNQCLDDGFLSMPQQNFKKCKKRIQHDRMLSVKVNFH